MKKVATIVCMTLLAVTAVKAAYTSNLQFIDKENYENPMQRGNNNSIDKGNYENPMQRGNNHTQLIDKSEINVLPTDRKP